ncbi:MAG: PilZ domain-containing protein [Spirochaetes bacterium]|nr:PilZ domain-containing protein [Spirochaetota bacterium]
MIVLQAGFRFINTGQGTQTNVIWFVVIFGVVVVALLVGAIVSRTRRGRTPEEMRRYSRHLFRRTAKSMGLTTVQAETLERLVAATKIRQPFLVFSSPALLDDVLRRGLYSVEANRAGPEEEREARKAVIFGIKQALERNARRGAVLRSTHLVKPGQVVAVGTESGGKFQSRVVSNMKDFLTILAPAADGTRWPRGTPVDIYFWREGDAGYTFRSKVLGYDTVKGTSCVLVQHTKTLRKEQRRRARRKELMRACFYYPVRIADAGGQRRAIIEHNLRALGTVVDLSTGGCAIQTMSPFEPGRLVMVEFDIERKTPIRAFGKVRGVRRSGPRGGVMHVMYTRVTRQYLNRICEFVYDFSKPRTVAEASVQARPEGARPVAAQRVKPIRSRPYLPR